MKNAITMQNLLFLREQYGDKDVVEKNQVLRDRLIDHVSSWTNGMSVTELWNALSHDKSYPPVSKQEIKQELVLCDEEGIMRQANNSRRWFMRRGSNGRY